MSALQTIRSWIESQILRKESPKPEKTDTSLQESDMENEGNPPHPENATATNSVEDEDIRHRRKAA